MTDVEWDSEEHAVPPPKIQTDRWEGEDEEEDLKDNWDDEDEEEAAVGEGGSGAPSPDPGVTTTAKKKKKSLKEIIAEKEVRQAEEAQKRQREREEARQSMNPEEEAAEKLRLQKIQEDADLDLVTELVGDTESEEVTTLDGFDLSSKENLEKFRIALVRKVRDTERLEKKPYFIAFVEDLSRELCVNMESDDIKRLTTVLNTLYNEKVKASKVGKGKKKSGKAKLNVGKEAAMTVIEDEYGHDEYEYDYDDFI